MADQVGPPAKKQKADGNVSLVDKSILLAAQDPEQWIANRRRNWPTRERIAQRQAEAERLREQQQQQQQQPQQAPAATGAREAPPVDAAETASDPAAGAAPRRKPPICRYFVRGRCNAGQKCRFTHEKPNQEPREARPAHERVYKRFEPPTKASLFVKLVQTDHDAEDEKLLDFIDYLYTQQLI